MLRSNSYCPRQPHMQDTVHLYAACARASPWLWLTPYAGHRAAEAVDAFITANWDSAEVGSCSTRVCEGACLKCCPRRLMASSLPGWDTAEVRGLGGSMSGGVRLEGMAVGAAACQIVQVVVPPNRLLERQPPQLVRPPLPACLPAHPPTETASHCFQPFQPPSPSPHHAASFGESHSPSFVTPNSTRPLLPPSILVQHAVSVCESYAALTAANRFSPHVRGFVRLVHAAMQHPLR